MSIPFGPPSPGGIPLRPSGVPNPLDSLRPNPYFIPLKPLDSGWGIQPIGSSPLGGDMHETFRVDSDGEISGGHFTIRIPGGQDIHIPWPWPNSSP